MACAHASCLYSPRWPRSSFASAHRGSRWKLSTESRSWCWSGAWGLHVSAGEIRSRVVWITVAKKRIKLRRPRLAFERAATGEGRAEDQAQSEQDPAEEATQARCISLDGSWWSRPCHRTVGAIGTSCNCIRHV